MPKNLALADLERSGLTKEDARKMEIEVYSREDSAELGLSEVSAGYTIPYFGLDGERTGFFRYRLLEDTSKGFAKLTGKTGPKYLQPPGTPPDAYLAPFIDWREIATDPDTPLVITEGEKKAAKATIEGITTIGLGGVWSFGAKKQNIEFLPTLEEFTWSGRKVHIIYDSDAAANADVRKAALALADLLIARGAVVHVGYLPTIHGGKVGLDDYLVANSADDFLAWLEDVPEVGASRALHKMNEEVTYIMDPGIVVINKTGKQLQPHAFMSHAYANRWHKEEVVRGKQTVFEKVQTAKAWIAWPHRAQLQGLTYAPGKPRIFEGKLNTWPGYAAEPKKGNIKPWKDLLDFIFEGAPPESRKWFEQWCAFPIQNPGTKSLSAAVLWSPAKGVGKSLVGEVLGRMYGENYSYITDVDLTHTNFNEWAENKQFVLADDITANSNRQLANYLKTLVTRDKVTINKKHLPTYVLPDCIQYLFTSNDPDALYIDPNERRYFVHQVRAQTPKPPDFYREIDKWSKSKEGQGALLYHLGTLSLEGFDPIAPALRTEDMKAMASLTRTELEQFLIDVTEEPDVVLDRLGGGDLVTGHELAMIFDSTGDGRRTSPILVARKLKGFGFDPVHRVRTKEGRVNLYALRNQEKWKRATPDAAREAYEKARGIRK